MGRLGERFIRFPHRCTIYRMVGVTPFSEGSMEVVWSGRCRKESNTSIRTFKGSDGVITTGYRVQLGSLVGGSLPGDAFSCYDGRHGEECGAVVPGIASGFLIDVEDSQSVFKSVTISDAYCGTLGTTVYIDTPKN